MTSAKKKKVRALAILCAVAAIAIATVVIIIGTGQIRGGAPAQQPQDEFNEERIIEDLSGDPSFMEGSASDEYVDAETYEVVEFTYSKREIHDTITTITGDATLKNTFFKEKRVIEASYEKVDEGWKLEGVTFETVSITALCGITNDNNHELSHVISEFNASEQTCSYTDSADTIFWYATLKDSTIYSYKFDGAGWSFVNESTESQLTDLQKIVGAYNDTRGEATREHGYFDSLTIDYIDEDAGTFRATWSWSQALLFYDESKGVYTSPNQAGATQEGTIYTDESGRVELRFGDEYANTFSRPANTLQGSLSFYEEEGTALLYITVAFFEQSSQSSQVADPSEIYFQKNVHETDTYLGINVFAGGALGGK